MGEFVKHRSFFLVALASLWLAALSTASAQTRALDPAAFAAIGRVDERFQSYNVEMAEVIGGRFWKPYARLQSGPTNAANDGAVALSADLFEARPPADLSDRRLRRLAAALGPAYIRVSGSWANTAYFQNDEAPAPASPPEGYRGVLTREQWRGVVDFANAVDAKLVLSFAINAAVRDADGVWTPNQARPFLEFNRSIGGVIYAAELFNEPNLSRHAGGPPDYDGPAFARDMAVFSAFAASAAPEMKIVGPGDSPGLSIDESFLSAAPRPRFDVFSYHFYGAVSQRCAPPTERMGISPERALSPDWLALTDRALGVHIPLRDRYAPGAPIWITETAGAACGGAPWSASYLDTFRYLDQMGRLAKQGVSAIFHNTLAASDYALIDDVTLSPRPNYWAALLWRRLMGHVVLDAGQSSEALHIYAHCLRDLGLRDSSGGVSLLAINLGDEAASLSTPIAAEIYLLSAPELQSRTMRLNGRDLALGRNDRLPRLRPQRLRPGEIFLPPHTSAFIALPRARNANCA